MVQFITYFQPNHTLYKLTLDNFDGLEEKERYFQSWYKWSEHAFPSRESLVNFQVGEHVVVHRVSQMVEQVLERSHAGEDGLDEVSQNCKHGKSSILHLLDLQILHLLLVLAEPEEVEEWASRVSRVSRASQKLLKAQEVLLAHGSGLVVVLCTAMLGESHKCNLQHE